MLIIYQCSCSNQTVSKQEEKRRESVSNYHLVVLGKLYLKLKKDSEHRQEKAISKKKSTRNFQS